MNSQRQSGKKVRLAITIGDPAGIGTEIILKALADGSWRQNADITLIGSHSVLAKTYQILQSSAKVPLANWQQLPLVDLDLDLDLKLGVGNASTGAASFAYLEKAIALTLRGEFDAIVTAPIAKSLWREAGYDYPGQTEVLARQAGVDRFGMMFVGQSPYTGWTLRTLLVTVHIPLAEVPGHLNPDLMSQKLDLTVEFLRENCGIPRPTIAIAGLNPHSGEGGNLGREERDWLNSWLEQERLTYPQARLMGLIPPDTIWVKPGQAWFHSKEVDVADAYLALYHDQGLIPVKLMAFDQAVNTTIGLPFIRTSPDHGTAFDIAGKGIASANSMKQAIALAISFSR